MSDPTTLTMTAATLLQFAFVQPTEKVTDPLHQAYFGEAHAAATEHGAVHLMTLDVVEAEHADIRAEKVIVLEWPSIDAWDAFHTDARWLGAAPLRDRAFASIVDVYFEVPETTRVTFDPDGLYETAAFWMNRHNGKLMGTYFENMGALVQAAQVQPQADLQVVSVPSHYATTPARLNLLNWGAGRAARDAIFTSQEFQDNGYLRALALDRMWTIIVRPET